MIRILSRRRPTVSRSHLNAKGAADAVRDKLIRIILAAKDEASRIPKNPRPPDWRTR